MQYAPFLATRRGKLVLLLLSAVGFLDFVDASIVNVALPRIRHDLGFSVPGLQWVVSGYVLTYGGFMVLGGRMADIIGRRRILIGGTTLLALASLLGGLAGSPGLLVGARLAQGLGAAAMVPAALSPASGQPSVFLPGACSPRDRAGDGSSSSTRPSAPYSSRPFTRSSRQTVTAPGSETSTCPERF